MPDPNVEPLGPCPDLSVIAAYVDGRLSDSERDVLQRHLASCDLCIELVTEVVAANEMDLAPVVAPPALLARLAARVRRGAGRFRSGAGRAGCR
jgi:anti-sigma factor RsiW